MPPLILLPAPKWWLYRPAIVLSWSEVFKSLEMSLGRLGPPCVMTGILPGSSPTFSCFSDSSSSFFEKGMEDFWSDSWKLSLYLDLECFDFASGPGLSLIHI